MLNTRRGGLTSGLRLVSTLIFLYRKRYGRRARGRLRDITRRADRASGRRYFLTRSSEFLFLFFIFHRRAYFRRRPRCLPRIDGASDHYEPCSLPYRQMLRIAAILFLLLFFCNCISEIFCTESQVVRKCLRVT